MDSCKLVYNPLLFQVDTWWVAYDSVNIDATCDDFPTRASAVTIGNVAKDVFRGLS